MAAPANAFKATQIFSATSVTTPFVLTGMVCHLMFFILQTFWTSSLTTSRRLFAAVPTVSNHKPFDDDVTNHQIFAGSVSSNKHFDFQTSCGVGFWGW